MQTETQQVSTVITLCWLKHVMYQKMSFFHMGVAGCSCVCTHMCVRWGRLEDISCFLLSYGSLRGLGDGSVVKETTTQACQPASNPHIKRKKLDEAAGIYNPALLW